MDQDEKNWFDLLSIAIASIVTIATITLVREESR